MEDKSFLTEVDEMNKTFFAKRAIIGKNLLVKKNVYLTVGSDGNVKNLSTDRPLGEIKEFKNDIIVPGFVNCHTHVVDAFAKEAGYGMDVESTVAPPNGLKHRLLKETAETKKIHGIRQAIIEFLSNGTTCFIDFREEGREGVALLRNALSNQLIKAKILGRPLTTENIETVLAISDGLGLSSLNKFIDEELESIRRSIQGSGKLVAYHASETPELRAESLRVYKESDILRGVKRLSPSFIVHATHATKSDIEYLKTQEIPVVLCPRANGYLGVGIPPIKRLVEAGISLCLGTDNLMLNAPDLFREFDYLVRIARLQGITLNPREIMKMVTVYPSMFLKERHFLEEGVPADFFVFELDKPNIKGMSDFLKALVLRGSKGNLKATYINGAQVWRSNFSSS
ncbi:MAG: amidohydrolase family protein [Candidatus Korarchaeota archaeon]|nr:amidohydrolase family protein [Candidatus Korarchaeota archaeon]NIU83143.1 amidohydrolase family protein [Candidatus Thorarchaeota archaeon]NIW13517.1 amidohydrolase family protein [Candidatus Thorarchaeota archaeon]